MADALRWGIVGCGDVVEKKSGPSILASPGSRITAVMRRQADKARAFAELAGAAVCTDQADEVIGHGQVDIVYVATPPSSHLPFVLAAAAAGKHVLVEKPMGLRADQSEAMVAACERAGVALFVAYYRRFHPHVLEMKRLIDAGAIGTPITASIDYAERCRPGHDWGWRVRPSVSGGGLFVDVVSHRIDLMNYLLGEPGEVRGLTIRRDAESPVEQAASLAVAYNGGSALCSITGDFTAARSADAFAVNGTAGRIVTDHLDGHRFTLETADGVKDYPFDRLVAPHVGLVGHIEDVLAGRATNACSGRDGALTDRILDAGLGRPAT